MAPFRHKKTNSIILSVRGALGCRSLGHRGNWPSFPEGTEKEASARARAPLSRYIGVEEGVFLVRAQELQRRNPITALSLSLACSLTRHAEFIDSHKALVVACVCIYIAPVCNGFLSAICIYINTLFLTFEQSAKQLIRGTSVYYEPSVKALD